MRNSRGLLRLIPLILFVVGCASSTPPPAAPPPPQATAAPPAATRTPVPTWTPTGVPPTPTLAPPTETPLPPTPTSTLGPITGTFPGSGGDPGAPEMDVSFSSGNTEELEQLMLKALDCTPGEATHETTLTLFGLAITTATVTRLEIRGMENGKCALYLRTESQDVRYTEEMVDQLLESGATQEDIQQQEAEANRLADEEIEGLDGVCRFETTELLTQFLTKWKTGTLSNGQWGLGECTGPIFDAQ